MTINFEEFCSMIRNTPVLPGVFRVSIVFEEKSPLCIDAFIKFWRALYKNISVLSSELSSDKINALLSTSFLGERYIYCLTDTKDIERIHKLCASYGGPHCLVIFSDQKKSKGKDEHIVVTVPSYVSRMQYQNIRSLLGNTCVNGASHNEYVNQLFVTKLLSHSAKIKLDDAIIFMRYHSLLESEADIANDFMTQWKEDIIGSSYSMFKLSELLLNQDTQGFFNYWNKHKHAQTVDGWITFWSNQLFNAASFVYLARVHNHQIAKSKTSLLPFSFLKSRWQAHSFENISRAHNALYRIELQAKLSAASLESLELWYHKFLLNRF